jgi:hypothetical protein
VVAAKQKQAEAIKQQDHPKRECPQCYQDIDARATRCNFCTSEIEPTYIHEMSVGNDDN